MTKSELVEAIVAARGDDGGDFPPSSPPGRLDGHSSGYSSDDGHEAGGEETDAGHLPALRRRVTVQDFSKSLDRNLHGRSFSMNCNIAMPNGLAPTKRSARIANVVKSPSRPNGLSRYVRLNVVVHSPHRSLQQTPNCPKCFFSVIARIIIDFPIAFFSSCNSTSLANNVRWSFSLFTRFLTIHFVGSTYDYSE